MSDQEKTNEMIDTLICILLDANDGLTMIATALSNIILKLETFKE